MSKEGQSSSVTAVKFVGEHYIASAGTADGGIKIWDKRKLCSLNQQHVPVHTFQMQSKSMRKPGFTSLVHDTHRSCLYAVGTDSLIYCYDTLCFGGQPNNIMSGHSCYSYYVKAAISPDNRFLLCGSSCSNAFVWDLQEPYSRPYVLSGHTKEVTCVAWSPKLVDLVATCSDDTSLRVWHSGTPPVHKTQTTCTCIGVCGLYDGELHTTGKKLMETHVWQSDPKTPDKENTPPATDDSDHFSTPTSSKKPNIVQKSLHSYFGLSRN
jgi:WD40 repeat protein